MSKRSRTVFSARAPRRPIDKELKVVNQTVSTSLVTTTLKTTTFPCTVTGLRWSFGCRGNTTSQAAIFWAIVVVPDGESANAPAISDGADFYTPEQNVLAFGAFRVSDVDAAVGGPAEYNTEGMTKSMRKLKSGDLLQFITIGDAAGALDGVVQFFCKS